MGLLNRHRDQKREQQVRKDVEAGVVAARAALLVDDLRATLADLRETLKQEGSGNA